MTQAGTGPAKVLTTFVIPAFNVEQYIGETIAGIICDPRTDIEVVVVDDGSTDGTATVVAAIGDARVRYLRQANQGVSRARNYGAENSTGQFLIFLDGDDLFDIGVLDSLHQPLLRDPRVVASYGTFAAFIDGQSAALPRNPLRRLRERPSGDILRALLQENVVGGIGTCCLRRSSFIETGGFNPALHIAEDWELFCRLACLGTFVHVPDAPALRYRQHRSSATARMSVDTARYQEFADILFAEPSVVARVGAAEIEGLRRSNLASYRIFVSMKAVQMGQLRTSWSLLWSAVSAYPRRAISLAGRYAWTVVQYYVLGGARDGR
jgi:glycosyltransferase involved in cell wall biosynthesis